jgi:DNA adenine methylase
MNKSPLKWMGSKKKLIKHILPLFPSKYNTYYEPFLGSGIVMFNLEPNNCVCSDVAPEPIIILNSIKDNYKEVYDNFKVMADKLWEEGEEYYYKLRSYYNENKENLDSIERASTFLILLRSCFNGVVRFNAKKNYSWNVPFGKRGSKEYSSSPLYNDNMLEEFKIYSDFLNRKNKEFKISHFKDTITRAGKDDLIYCDPPYITTGQEYSSWTIGDEALLAKELKAAHSRGAKFVLSNVYMYKGEENTPLKELYKEFNFVFIDHEYIIGPKAKRRQKVEEVLITNF